MLEIRPDLTKKNVLKRVNTLDIFKRYCANFKSPGVKFRERDDDSVPSCMISMWNGDYLYKDFGAIGSYRAIDYVAFKHGESFRDALERINRDFQLGLGSELEHSERIKPIINPHSSSNTSTTKTEKLPSIIKIKRREWEERDLKFWGSMGWTLDLLELARIYPITHFWITNPRKGVYHYKNKVDPEKIAYTFDYYLHNEVFRRKLYFPGEELKFISNVDYTIVQGYPALPRFGDILIITSSLKDCGPFWRLGYPAIAPNSESEFFYDKFLSKLKNRYKNIIIWFDNDAPGIKFAQKFSSQYNLHYTHNPPDSAKDPSDFVYKYGLEEFKTLVTILLNELTFKQN